MENKKYLITPEGEFTTNIPVDLVNRIEKALQNIDHRDGLKFTASIYVFHGRFPIKSTECFYNID